MGNYRTLATTLTCLRCGGDHRAYVQFKTGDDAAMSGYEVGDVAADLVPDVHEGCADAYCPRCTSRWIADHKRTHFELLSEEVAAGRVAARRATWRHGSLDGRPELGLVVTLDDAADLTADDVRALAESREILSCPAIGVHLSTAWVSLWQGDLCLYPEVDTSIDSASGRWWIEHHQRVATRLAALGWPEGGSQWIDVMVLVDGDHRVRLAPPGSAACDDGDA